MQTRVASCVFGFVFKTKKTDYSFSFSRATIVTTSFLSVCHRHRVSTRKKKAYNIPYTQRKKKPVALTHTLICTVK